MCSTQHCAYASHYKLRQSESPMTLTVRWGGLLPAYKQRSPKGICIFLEIASMLRNLWDHMKHVRWINLFFICDNISVCISVYLPIPHHHSTISCSLPPYISSLITLSLHHNIPYFLFSPAWSSRSRLHISNGTDSDVTSGVLLVCFPQETSGLALVRGIQLFSTWLPSVHSWQRKITLKAFDAHLNMNEAYIKGSFTQYWWVMTHYEAEAGEHCCAHSRCRPFC